MACRLFLYVGLSLKTASFASEQGAAMICLRGKDVQWWLFPGFREVLRGRQAGKSDSDALLLKKEESGRHPLFMERDSFCVLLFCLSPCVHAILCAFNGRRQLSPSHARGCLKAAMQPSRSLFQSRSRTGEGSPLDLPPKRVQKAFSAGQALMLHKDRQGPFSGLENTGY